MKDLQHSAGSWLRVSFFNLTIVALVGVILRYKIAYSLPWIHQKFLMHAHSHFAFAGWISLALMAMMIAAVVEATRQDLWRRYRWLLYLNLISAFGMLVTFTIQGYGAYSITFSVITILVSYIFTVMFWKDLDKYNFNYIPRLWFKAALIFNVISSFGAFSLAYMMVNKIAQQNSYLAAVYFFLHFQYNGWFFFGCIGLLYTKLKNLDVPYHKLIFLLFAGACIPAFFLSALWLPMPMILYVLVVIAAIAQVIAWVMLLKNIKPQYQHFRGLARIVIGLAAIACSIKLLLQAGSTIPALSDLAFGFRPIVIGYLHLVLLGVITLFLIGYSIFAGFVFITKLVKAGVIIFTSGIVINEVLLMLQGVAGMRYIVIPYINELLLIAGIIMLVGIFLITLSNYRLRT